MVVLQGICSAQYLPNDLWPEFLKNTLDWWPAILSKNRLQHTCFPVNFDNFLKALFHRTRPVAASGILKDLLDFSLKVAFFEMPGLVLRMNKK